ncbi:MAG TPA: pantoate--beta-alanine ligase, partial [Salinimicrobium sp.]|nr:pantoate--beta-alanine ligase [Salinimicrobium sp.]
LETSDKVVLSIFVNPTQFDKPGDLEKYPRDLDKDLGLLHQFREDLIIFSPLPSEIYGNSVISESFDFGGLEKGMEGKFRTGHFDGVGTVVKKLFEIIEPDEAFFGEKDYQQLQIIRKMAQMLHLNTRITGCPIEREDSGLARSSRNERLSPEQRKKAAFLFKTLQQVKVYFGTKSAFELRNWVEKEFRNNPDLELEYFEITESNDLKSVEDFREDHKYRAFIAAFIGDIRLIDNIALN